MARKIKAAIAGATGYTGGELLRILLNHPDVDNLNWILVRENSEGEYSGVGGRNFAGSSRLIIEGFFVFLILSCNLSMDIVFPPLYLR